jgi:CubicO group peptidase (beta-lactamase class C family)
MSTGGLSRARLTRMHQVLAGYVERGDVPGLVALVSRRGETHVDPIGLPREAIFRISSMTKPVTAVAALILVEQCKLRLDEPIDRLLPELSQRRVLERLDSPLDETLPAHRPITLRDLLTFRMGFGQLFPAPDPCPVVQEASKLHIGMGPPLPDEMAQPDEWLRRVASLPLMAQPGERWIYNTGADVLGVLIARAADQPFEDFLRERVFEPLGMRDTAFSVPPDKLSRLQTSFFAAGQVFDPAEGGQWSHPPAFPSGAGGLVSTADDYVRFAQMLLDNGKPLLARPTVELMTSNQLTSEQTANGGMILGDRGWGFLVSIVMRRDDLASVGAYGWDGGLGTYWRNDPREQLITILMTQSAWGAPRPPQVGQDFSTLAYQAMDD